MIEKALTQEAETLAHPSTHLARLMRFASSSLMCTAVDQAIAWTLFSTLELSMGEADFLRILVATVVARLVSLSLNYRINLSLVFGEKERERRTFVRFLALATLVLILSSVGVFCAHTFLGAPEWQAKIVVDLTLFFLNYNAQRMWVFAPAEDAGDLVAVQHL